jgi:predicted nucleic acid-binding Zn ribbon protein
MRDPNDEFADDLDEREEPDCDDADWNLDPDVVDCPLCGGEISEEAEYCPHCRNYVVSDGPRRKSPWIVAGVVLLVIVVMVVWVMHGW